MTKRQSLLAAVSVLVLIGGGWAALQTGLSDHPADASVASARFLTVRTVSLVQEESFTRRRRFTGQIVAARTSDLSFQLPGQLDTLLFDEGESVRQGETLATLDTQRLRANRKRLEAELLQAQAVLLELRNGSREEDIRAARAEVQQLAAETVLVKNRLERMSRLAERGTSTQDELELAHSNWESTAARLAAAEARRDEIIAGPRTEQIEAQQATVSALEAAIEEVDVQLEDSILTAPYAGTLSARLLDQGAVVSAGEPVFRIVEDQSLEFHVGLPNSAVASLSDRSGLDVMVGGRSLPAQAARKLPVLNTSTRTQTVILQLANADGVVPGQTGELLLEERIEQPGYWVPNTALEEGIQGLWTCYVATPGEASEGSHNTIEPRDVEVLHVEEDRSFVRGTLSDGELLVTSGLHRLVADQPVTLITEN